MGTLKHRIKCVFLKRTIVEFSVTVISSPSLTQYNIGYLGSPITITNNKALVTIEIARAKFGCDVGHQLWFHFSRLFVRVQIFFFERVGVSGAYRLVFVVCCELSYYHLVVTEIQGNVVSKAS